MPINIGILDDHLIVIQGLKLLLENEPQFDVVVESNNGFAFIEKIAECEKKLDLVLIDLTMPVISGYETALLLKDKFPDLRIIVLSMNNDIKTIHYLVDKVDIRGFISKAVDKEVFVAAIELVHSGSYYFTEDILAELEKFTLKGQERKTMNLSVREIEIVDLIGRGMTNKDIAATLYISELTAATHRKNIFRKTGTHNAASLIEVAKRLEIIS